MRANWIVWVPRVLMIAFILFLSLFALDVFQGEGSVLSKITGFLIHLIPSFVLTAFLVVAWRKPRIGGWLVIAAGLLMTLWFETYHDLAAFLGVSFPAIAAGVLFVLHPSPQTVGR